MHYKYDRGDHRRKHCWNRDSADFVEEQGHLVGKCPSTVTDAVAERLLNQAVAEPDPFAVRGRATAAWPRRLYAVYHGVVYEAVPTQPGTSYHGYPWRGRSGRGPLPTEVIEQLRIQAGAEGFSREFEGWLDEHS